MVPADEIGVEAVSVNQVAKDLQRVPVAITLTMDRNQICTKDQVPATIDQAQGRVSRTRLRKHSTIIVHRCLTDQSVIHGP